MFSKTVNMLHEMQVYTRHFEPRLMEISQEYVVKWADAESSEKSLPEYVRGARALMDREMERVDLFSLPNTTKRELLTLLEDHLISKKEPRLINQDELADLLEENAVKDLELLYTLLERRKLGANLRPGFTKWIEDEGTAIVFNEKEQDNMVIHLLSLKRQLDSLWKTAFHRDEGLGHGLRESFDKFMNKTKKTSASWGTDNSKTGEMIAKYVDMLLRGGAKAIPTQLSRKAEKPAAVEAEEDNEDAVFDEDTEVNNQLDQVLDLFRFLHGKAVFEAFYKKDLARRLLMGRSASADAERSMLSRLKIGKCLSSGVGDNITDLLQNAVLVSPPTWNRCSATSSSRARRWHHTKTSARSATRSPLSILTSTCFLRRLGQHIPPLLSSCPHKSKPQSPSSKHTTRSSTLVAS
jgi:cullin-4